MNLFDAIAEADAPLAARMRPRQLAEVVGQEHILGHGKLLSRLIRADKPPSMVLWGPPGTGKTTLAEVVARESRAHFVHFSAVLEGVPQLRKHLALAEDRKRMGERTILFVDEIHRFNKAQQDALLPQVEAGVVTLIGATTENPSFAVNSALLSRARVFRLEAHTEAHLVLMLRRALESERGLAGRVTISDEAVELLARAAKGDARQALSTLETLAADGRPIDVDSAAEAIGDAHILYDKDGEEHYNVVSALIKSMRGSDPDAAVYWLMRMLEGGEDPAFITRRLLIFASEDIGNADPRALSLAVSTDQAFSRLGLPEGLHCLAQCVVYLAIAPKSNATYAAFKAAREDIRRRGALPVPMHLRNAATQAMKSWGYGAGYRYPHDEGGVASGVSYLPDALADQVYYEPSRNGLEGKIAARVRARRAAQGRGGAVDDAGADDADEVRVDERGAPAAQGEPAALSQHRTGQKPEDQ